MQIIRKGPGFEQIRVWAADLVREAALRPISGEEKRDEVVDKLVELIDKALKWGPGPAGRIAEWMDGRLARILLTPLVHEVYLRLRDDL